MQRLTHSGNHIAGSISPDNRYVALADNQPGIRADDLLILTLEEESLPKLFLRTEFTERSPVISPDGRWLAYASDETGRAEIYVRPFPSGPGKWQISTQGGLETRWSSQGKELFYNTFNPSTATVDAMYVVSYQATGDSFQAANPRHLFSGNFARDGFDVTPDGKRFVMLQNQAGSAEPGGPTVKLVYMQNWFEELKRLVPTDK